MRWLLLAGLVVAAFVITGPRPGVRVMDLPRGTVDVHRPLTIAGPDVWLRGHDTVLRAAPDFNGRAVIECRACRNARISGFAIDGNRAVLERREGLPPSNVPFARFTRNNGILIEDAAGVRVTGVRFSGMAGFAVLAVASRGVTIERVQVRDSGSRNPAGRNNTTGGILLEEGSSAFAVRDSDFENIRGNGVWTHSLYTSARNHGGAIEGNRFRYIGRDAIQVGHATRIRVRENRGSFIGFPPEEVDIEAGGTPVGVDSSGNVDASRYQGNRFEEVNGKCIDLDGFHNGEVIANACVNRAGAERYPHGHFGIVINNWNPDMQSRHITIAGNLIDGAKFGGIFVIGQQHTIRDNRLLNLNLAHCNENAAQFGCVAIAGEPAVLESGIYLGRVAAEWAQKRADASRGHLIENNVVTGWKMRERCIAAAPGVSLAASTVRGNRCYDLVSSTTTAVP